MNVLSCTGISFHILMLSLFSEHVCLVDGKLPISVPIVAPEQKLDHFNVLFAHLFSVLANSQALSAYDINPSKLLTVTSLLDSTFPAIKATNNQPMPLVSPRTVGYIHALIIDTVSLHHSDSPNCRALRTEIMVRDELQKSDPAVLRTELMTCFTSYYEGILKMEGASGLPLAVAFTRSFNAVPPPPVPDAAGGSVSEEEEGTEDAAAGASEPAAAAPAEPAAAAPAGPVAGRRESTKGKPPPGKRGA